MAISGLPAPPMGVACGHMCLPITPSVLACKDLRYLAKFGPYVSTTDFKVQRRSRTGYNNAAQDWLG